MHDDGDGGDGGDGGRYEAVRSRDGRFDGAFFFAVSTTGIYCRPSCPATTPKRRNVRFFPSAAAAQRAGFRACRRCRPDAVPGSAAWEARADLVGRAVRLIGDGVVDREGVTGLAARLGYSARQVQRQLGAELGAGPIALARAQRAHTARILLQTTALRATEIAFAAGFASVRQFNDTVRAIYATTPGELRAARPAHASRRGATDGAGAPGADGAASGIPLRLAYRGPYAATGLFDHLAAHALDGVEEITGGTGRRVYRRALDLPHAPGIAEVGERTGDGWLECRLHLGDLRDLTTATRRIRRLFDLDADPYAVAERLGADPLLAPLVRHRPGLRAPGAADPHESAVRTVLGLDDRTSLPAVRTRGAALVRAYGRPLPAPSGTLTHVFPRAADLADAPPTGPELPGGLRTTVRALAAALARGTVRLDPGADRDEAERALLALDGITPWTAGHIRMRALGDPDVLLTDDAAVRADPHRTERWRPWRTYATHHLRETREARETRETPVKKALR
ncbi:AlkA N-terminal domain-containing protein [Streptomyces sp. NPDC093085]|uniref:bifunctional transcriptional activator/DNA repair enzyme AdaA n=1 Tax=Streptomyces sp. NPDC093085 TaxID=3155068 RepID=UPI00343DD761